MIKDDGIFFIEQANQTLFLYRRPVAGGRPMAVGSAAPDLQGYQAVIDAPYNPDDDSDAVAVAVDVDRDAAIAALWGARWQAYAPQE